MRGMVLFLLLVIDLGVSAPGLDFTFNYAKTHSEK